MVKISLMGLLMRFILGGGAIAASTLVSRALGGKVGGIFAAFPAVYLSAVLTLGLEPHTDVLSLARHISIGALVGMIANVICAVAASILIARRGWKSGLAYALVIWLISATGIYLTWIKISG